MIPIRTPNTPLASAHSTPKSALAPPPEIFISEDISVYHFTTSQLPENNYKAPIDMTGVRLADNLLQLLFGSNSRFFSHKNISINIEYAMLNFSHTEANIYQYRHFFSHLD